MVVIARTGKFRRCWGKLATLDERTLLMLALAKIGRNPDTGLGAGDVACRLIHNDTFPPWWLSPPSQTKADPGRIKAFPPRT